MRADAQTKADELESPADIGTVPSTITCKPGILECKFMLECCKPRILECKFMLECYVFFSGSTETG